MRSPGSRRRLLLSCFATLAVFACKSKAPAGPSVKLYVDETQVGTVAVTSSPVPLASLLPAAASDPASWKRIEGRATGGRFLDVRQPTTTYQDGEVRLYLQQGTAAVGIFRPVRPGLPEHIAKIARQPAVSLADLVDVRVYTRAPPPAVVATLEIEATGLPAWTMAPADLEEIPEAAKTDGSRARGRALADVVRFRIDGSIERVIVEGRDGRSHTITAGDLDDPEKKLLVKVNNKNQWVFKDWSGGEATTEIRDLVRLQVVGSSLRHRGGAGTAGGSRE